MLRSLNLFGILVLVSAQAFAGNVTKYLECKSSDESVAIELAFISKTSNSGKVFISRESMDTNNTSDYDYALIGVYKDSPGATSISFMRGDSTNRLFLTSTSKNVYFLTPNNQPGYRFMGRKEFLTCASGVYSNHQE